MAVLEREHVFFGPMAANQTFHLPHEFTILKQRLNQTADPVERVFILAKMSAIIREINPLLFASRLSTMRKTRPLIENPS